MDFGVRCHARYHFNAKQNTKSVELYTENEQTGLYPINQLALANAYGLLAAFWLANV